MNGLRSHGCPFVRSRSTGQDRPYTLWLFFHVLSSISNYGYGKREGYPLCVCVARFFASETFGIRDNIACKEYHNTQYYFCYHSSNLS